jgi:molecular chaperone IbpA
MTNTQHLTLRAGDIPGLHNIHKFAVGFDNIFNELERVSNQRDNYPPYNVVQISDDEYAISIAVAGFGPDNLSVTQDKNFLIIEGQSPVTDSDDEPNYIHRGLSSRNFRREFKLADHVEIRDARLELGILTIHLVREVPEAERPKTIAITYNK